MQTINKSDLFGTNIYPTNQSSIPNTVIQKLKWRTQFGQNIQKWVLCVKYVCTVCFGTISYSNNFPVALYISSENIFPKPLSVFTGPLIERTDPGFIFTKYLAVVSYLWKFTRHKKKSRKSATTIFFYYDIHLLGSELFSPRRTKYS